LKQPNITNKGCTFVFGINPLINIIKMHLQLIYGFLISNYLMEQTLIQTRTHA
jgi:hypothetical protein